MNKKQNIEQETIKKPFDLSNKKFFLPLSVMALLLSLLATSIGIFMHLQYAKTWHEHLAKIQEIQKSVSQMEIKTAQIQNNKINNNKNNYNSLIKIYFLVKTAELHLISDKNLTTATQLLMAAKESVENSKDPSMINIKNAISQDINNLNSVKGFSADAIALQLNILQKQLQNLVGLKTIRKPPQQDKATNKIEYKNVNNILESIKNRSIIFFKNSVFIRYQSEKNPHPLFLTRDQEYNLVLHMQTKLQLAEIAIINGQQDLYHLNLQEVSSILQDYFANFSSIEITNILASLDKLSKIQPQIIPLNFEASERMMQKLMTNY